jgi:hypothetical protein
MIEARRDDLVFFVLIPCAIGLLLFLFNGMPANFLPSHFAVLFWITAVPSFWMILHISTRAVAWFARSLHLPLLVLLVLGALLALFPMRALYVFYGTLYTPLFLQAPPLAIAPIVELSWSFARAVLWQAANLVVIWVGINCLLDHYLGQGRYRLSGQSLRASGPPAANSPTESPRVAIPLSQPPVDQPIPLVIEVAAPEFMKRVPVQRRGAIILIKAEDHYLKVLTSKGESLIHYRLSDAIAEMPGDSGIRVHRSYWVARDAITSVEPAGRKLRMMLVNGVEIPVSLSYKQAVLDFYRANDRMKVDVFR